MEQHSLLGASAASRWLNCPGSFQLSRRVKPAPPSIYAETGSVAHSLIEEAGARNFTLSRDKLLNTTRDSETGRAITIDEDMLDAIDVMLDYARTRVKGRLFRTEMRVYPKLPFTPPVDVFGSLDLAIVDVHANWFEIVDYKHGAGVPVKVENNAQLLFYAAGVLAYLLKIAPSACEQIFLTVVQPRVPGQTPVKTWAIDVLDLELWIADVLVPGIKACLEPSAPYNPGPHCQFCPGVAACPALLAEAQATAKKEFEDDSLRAPLTLGEQLDLADELELWIEKIREDAKARIEAGERIKGWRLVPTRATRKWIDENQVVDRAKILGLTPKDIFTEELVSPAQMEKVVVRKLGHNRVDAFALLSQSVSSGTKLAKSEQDQFDLLEALDGC